MKTEETKEAIMFLENTLYMCIRGEDDIPGYKTKYNHWIRKVIALLKRGERHEAMWEKLRDKNMCFSRPDGRYIDDEDFEKLEKKYFPKKKVIK